MVRGQRGTTREKNHGKHANEGYGPLAEGKKKEKKGERSPGGFEAALIGAAFWSATWEEERGWVGEKRKGNLGG